MNTTPSIWQSSVIGTYRRQTALGRLFIADDEVFYFPETPRRWASALLAPATALFGGILLWISSPMVTDQMEVFQTPRGPYAPDASALLIVSIVGAILLMAAMVQFMLFARNQSYVTLNAREQSGTDQYLGMSIEERFALSPNAFRFRLDEVASIHGKRRLKIRPKDGEVYQFKTRSNSKNLLDRLRRSTSVLPREVLDENGTVESPKAAHREKLK